MACIWLRWRVNPLRNINQTKRCLVVLLCPRFALDLTVPMDTGFKVIEIDEVVFAKPIAPPF